MKYSGNMHNYKKNALIQNDIETGQGKSLTSVILAILLKYENDNNSIDIIHTTESLSNAHMVEFKALYEMAGITANYVNLDNPNKSDEINFGTALSIITADAELSLNRDENKNRKTITIVDEYDRFVIDDAYYLGSSNEVACYDPIYLEFCEILISIIDSMYELRIDKNIDFELNCEELYTTFLCKIAGNENENELLKQLHKYWNQDNVQDFIELIQGIISTKQMLPIEAHRNEYHIEFNSSPNGKTTLTPMSNGEPKAGMAFTGYIDLMLRLRINRMIASKNEEANKMNHNGAQIINSIEIIKAQEPISINTFASYANDKTVIGLTGSPIVNETKGIHVKIPSFEVSKRKDEIYFTKQDGSDYEDLLIKYANNLMNDKNLIVHVKDMEEGKRITEILEKNFKNAQIKSYYGSLKNEEAERFRENNEAIDFVSNKFYKNEPRILVTSVLNRGSDFKAGAVNELKTYFKTNDEDSEASLQRMKQELGRVARSGSDGRSITVLKFQELIDLLDKKVFSVGHMDEKYLIELSKSNNFELLKRTIEYLSKSIDKKKYAKQIECDQKGDKIIAMNDKFYASKNITKDMQVKNVKKIQKELEEFKVEEKNIDQYHLDQINSDDQFLKIKTCLVKNLKTKKIKSQSDVEYLSSIQEASNLQELLCASIKKTSGWDLSSTQEGYTIVRWFNKTFNFKSLAFKILIEILKLEEFSYYLEIKGIPKQFSNTDLREYAETGEVVPILKNTKLYYDRKFHYLTKMQVHFKGHGNNRISLMSPIISDIDFNEEINKNFDVDDIVRCIVGNYLNYVDIFINSIKMYKNSKYIPVLLDSEDAKWENYTKKILQSMFPIYKKLENKNKNALNQLLEKLEDHKSKNMQNNILLNQNISCMKNYRVEKNIANLSNRNSKMSME